MRTPGDARTRILLLFFLGIALPGFLLGYLAFRGVQNDQALVERERHYRHRQIAELIADSLDAGIARIEQPVDQATLALQGTESPDGHAGLDSLRLREPLIQAVFVLDRSGVVRFPGHPLLFSKDAENVQSGSPQGPFEISGELQAARVLELRNQDYPEALAAYREVYSGASEDRVRGEALNAIARIQAKSESLPEAAESYARLRREFGTVRMANGTPFGVAAQLELGSVLLAAGDRVGAARALLALLRDLIGGEWLLRESQFDFFSRRTRDTLGQLLAQEDGTPSMEVFGDSLAILAEEEASKRLKTQVLLAFLETAGDGILPRLEASLDASVPGEEGGGNLRMTLEAGGQSHHVSVQRPIVRDSTEPAGWWGILFDQEILRNDLLGSTIRQNTNLDQVGWLVKDRTGDTVLASPSSSTGPPSITATLGNGILPYTLELYEPTPRLVETLLTSRRGVYFYAFLLLTGILVFGLTLTIRSVTNELELARLKSDFVSTVSHEFKSPLTAIRHMTEILLSDRVPSEDRRRRYYQVMLEQSERLSLLIDNILDLARMEEGRLELRLEMVDAGDLLREVVEAVDHRIRHEGFLIRSDIEDRGPTIPLDADALTQATTNLIDNAVKYSGESREIIVHGFSDDTHFNVAVEDFGIGLNAKEKERVFERFYRGGDELTRSVKGTGLGLTLVKRIAEAHGGSVVVESEPGRGSTFTIRLPLAASAGGNHGSDPDRRRRGSDPSGSGG
jgi:signal transduction histidine kinase